MAAKTIYIDVSTSLQISVEATLDVVGGSFIQASTALNIQGSASLGVEYMKDKLVYYMQPVDLDYYLVPAHTK